MAVEVKINASLNKKMDSKLLTNAIKKAMKDTSKIVERECADYAPVDTGHLRRSYNSEVQDLGEATRAVIKNSAKNKDGQYYWVFQEYGTRYIPAGGYVARALEVAEPKKEFLQRFGSYYKPNG